MGSIEEIKFLGLKVLKYTLLTTLLAAAVALVMFVLYSPVHSQLPAAVGAVPAASQGAYWSYVLKIVPTSFVQPFVENNVIGAMFLAMTLGLAIIALDDGQRKTLHHGFAALYAAIMKITIAIIKLMPLAVWAFVALFVRDLREGLEIESVALYLAAVVSANLVQAIIILPLLLKTKGIAPMKLFKDMLPALSLGFFSKSSSATLPMALSCAQKRAGLSSKVSNFSFPLCTTINMNGCAAFILITVLFVSMSHGMQFSPLEMATWIFIATIAAVGNAGVPMGCFFLSSAFLAAMDVPLHMMGIILPFYTLIDMLETSVNVWSDSCVTAIVQAEVPESYGSMETPLESLNVRIAH
jgi:Na+/H+-dicarboxylate symporter